VPLTLKQVLRADHDDTGLGASATVSRDFCTVGCAHSEPR
jgi:hypothetical protein